MSKKAVWNNKTEEFLKETLSMGASAREASENLFTKFNMIFTRNSIIGKARRLDIEFLKKTPGKYVEGSLEYQNLSKQKKVDNAKFIKAWKGGVSIGEMEKMFGIKHRSIVIKAKRLRLNERNHIHVVKKIKDPNKTSIRIDPSQFSRSEFPNPDAKSITFMELEYNSCRFVIGDGKPSDFLYCGAVVPNGADVPYCEHCRPIVYISPKIKINKIMNEVKA
jgi:hypothetical protein